MARDSLYCERILWQGRCRAATVPFSQKALAVVASVARVSSAAHSFRAFIAGSSVGADTSRGGAIFPALVLPALVAFGGGERTGGNPPGFLEG